MSEHDLYMYRRAKVISKDLEEIRIILKDSYKKFSKYKKYIPIKSILNELLSAEVVLKLVHDAQKDVLKNKGKIDE